MVEGFITTREAAEALGYQDAARIRQMVADGTIKGAEKVSRNLLLIPISEVERLKTIERKQGRPPKKKAEE